MRPKNTPNPDHLASAFTDEEVRQATPEKRAWIFRVLALAHQTGSSVEMAREAVEAADREKE